MFGLRKIFFSFNVIVSGFLCPCEIPAQDFDFGKQIRPILTRNCISCHGADEDHREADLRLDTFDGATDWAIVPGDPDDSEVMARVTSDDDGDRMPPPEHGAPLSANEIKLLSKWIESGAKYSKHWSFVKPVADAAPMQHTQAE